MSKSLKYKSPGPSIILVLLFQIILASCASTKRSENKIHDRGSLTQLFLNDNIDDNVNYPRNYLIDYVQETNQEIKKTLKFDSLCTNHVVESNRTSELKLEYPHNAITMESLNREDYANTLYFHVHPIYKAKANDEFCFIVSSGYDIEYTGESWGVLYKPYVDATGTLVLGDIIEDFIKWF